MNGEKKTVVKRLFAKNCDIFQTKKQIVCCTVSTKHRKSAMNSKRETRKGKNSPGNTIKEL